MVATPKFASAVILFKLIENSAAKNGSNSSDFTIFLIQRSREMKFLGGVHAFPGGKLEEDDLLEKNLARCKGLDKTRAHQLILDNNTHHTDMNYSLGFWIAGIREVFEEVGILFAYDRHGTLVDFSNPAQKTKFQEYRNELLQDKIRFSEIIAREDLFYAVGKLLYFLHFVTPELSPIRYDTRFFLAELPPHQSIDACSAEIISMNWDTPNQILKNYRNKVIKLIPPQFACISKLQKVSDIKAFCEKLV